MGTKGTTLRLGYSYSDVELGGIFKAQKFESSSHDFITSISQQLIRTSRFNLSSDLSWDMRHGQSTILETTRIDHYENRALRTGINAFLSDNHGRWLSRAEVSTGLPILGGSSNSAYGVGSSKYVKLNGNLTRLQFFPNKFTGIFRAAFQYSPDALLSAEQFQVGGSNTVRGFEEGSLLGDNGYVMSLELRRPIPGLPNLKIPYWKDKSFSVNLKDRIQIGVFYDQGVASAIHDGESMNYKNFLQSVGAGIHCYITKYLLANVDLGVPLGRIRYDGQKGVRVHFSISSNMF